MKYLILIFLGLSFLFISSCTPDDNEEVIPEKLLLKHVIKTYEIYPEKRLRNTTEQTYENNKVKSFFHYNADNVMTSYSNWSYNGSGLLSNIKSFSSDNVLLGELNIEYDNLNRITRIENISDYTITSTFTHNSDQTITSNYIGNGTSRNIKFHLNSDGLVYKQTSDDVFSNANIEIEYEGNNPVSITSDGFKRIYTYDSQNVSSGVYFDVFKNLFGDFKSNLVLFENSAYDAVRNFKDKHVSKVEYSHNGNDPYIVIEYEYTFDEDNDPLTIKTFYTGDLQFEEEFTYE